jgi:hypothetical protein
MALPSNWIAAASLKAPGSPWKATRADLRSDVLIGWRYLAISGTKQKAEFVERATNDLASRVEHNLYCFRPPKSLILGFLSAV